MKGLNQFASFDFARFCQGKRFVVTASKAWVDYETKQHLGTVVEVAITKDQTAYKPGKDGKAISNLFEKMDWKIEQDINIPDGISWVRKGFGKVAEKVTRYAQQTRGAKKLDWRQRRPPLTPF